MKDYLRLIDTTPRGRYDVSPLFADAPAFQEMVEDIASYFDGDPVDLAAGIDALGFILGTAVAFRLQRGFLPIRKAGKLPGETLRAEFVDYTGTAKALEVRQDAFKPGARILIVDEWIETGAQMSAAVWLIESLGGLVAGIATLGMDTNPTTLRLLSKYKIFAASENF